MPTTVTFTVQARPDQWQYSNVSLAPGETAEITASGTWGVIDPPKRGETGPAGNDVDAGHSFVKPGPPAKEGGLVVKDGAGNLYTFASNSAAVVIHVPGPISFMANDDMKAPGGRHVGFEDNRGALTANIAITRTQNA